MQLIDLRNEVLAHGFDPVQFGSARVNMYINAAQGDFARKIDYYVEEASQTTATAANVATFALPADIGKLRYLVDTDNQRPLKAVPLKYIDSSPVSTGTPLVYALDGANVHLYPTPDGVHNLLLRYWKMPADLVNDTDVPSIPVDFQDALWYYAVALCYKAEDDFQMGAQWMNDYNASVSAAAAALKFINSDAPTQAQSMWSGGPGAGRGWSLSGLG